jgi:uncharacterized lipoprotein YajG
MKNAKVLAVCLTALAITACSTNNVGLAYKPSAAIVAGDSNSSKVSVGSFIDQRGETATWIGAVRGGYGNPLKTLEATTSVSMLVQTAFSDGLRARGLQASAAGASSYQISGVIKKLDCSQYVRREAHAVIQVDVFEASTGKKVFTQTYTADELEGSLLALNAGAFGSVESLRALAEKALNEVVDKALDDTALRNAMRQSGA